jgi:hypothetical protein
METLITPYIEPVLWFAAAFVLWLTARYPLAYVIDWCNGLFVTQTELERRVRGRQTSADAGLTLFRYLSMVPAKAFQLWLFLVMFVAIWKAVTLLITLV